MSDSSTTGSNASRTEAATCVDAAAQRLAELRAQRPSAEPKKLAVSIPKTSPCDPPATATAPVPTQAQSRQRARAVLLNGGFPRRHIETLDACRDEREHPWRLALDGLLPRLDSGILIPLLGRRGTGKTQLAVALASALIQRDPSATVRYVKAADLFRQLREAMHEGREAAALESLRRVSLLVIDEAHERGHTDYEDRTLVGLIDKRYDAMRDTLLIANQTRAEFAASIGASVVSRIHEVGEALECDWPSFRGR